MKNLTFALAMTFTVSNAFALESILDNVQSLPKIYKQQLIVNYGPDMAAVQPTAFIKFDFASCRQFDFSVAIIDGGDVDFLKITYPKNQAECRGLPVKRTYELQLSSDYSNYKPFIVLNPIAQEPKFTRPQL